MVTSTVTIKGQIVIPAALRKRLGIKKGTVVFIEERNGDIVVHPATPEFYEKSFGVLKGAGLLQDLQKERREDLTREERKVSRKAA